MQIKLNTLPKTNIGSSEDIFVVMQRILLRENRIDRNREHFWTISLDNALSILAIELVSMGSVKETIAEPMEIFSLPLQKRAVKVILVHNHPSSTTKPSESDKDLTDNLIQVGRIMRVPVIDHLIITEKSYYSFADSGLLATLEQSLKYVPPYEIKKRHEEEAMQKGKEKGIQEQKKEMARMMKQNGEPINKIIEYTGLTKQVIQRLK